jgi:hypothetical protein
MGEEDTSFNPEELDAQLKSLRARKRRNWEARKLRVAKSFKELIRVLGGKCEARNQGKGRCRGPLSVEHRNGRTWSVRSTSWPGRVAIYWEEYRSGVALGVLCLGHNTSAAHLRKLLGMNRRKR